MSRPERLKYPNKEDPGKGTHAEDAAEESAESAEDAPEEAAEAAELALEVTEEAALK